MSSGISPPDVAGSRRTPDARLRTPDRSAKSHPAVRRSRRQRLYQEPLTPPLPPPRTSPGEDPRRVPERGARALPAPLADLVVRTQRPLAVRVSLDVGVKPEPAPQWLPIHGPTLGVADPTGKGSTARRARTSSPQSPRVGRSGRRELRLSLRSTGGELPAWPVAADDDDLAVVRDAYAFHAVTLAIRRPLRRVPRHQDLVGAGADPSLLHVEIYLLELGTLQRHGFPRYPAARPMSSWLPTGPRS